MRDVPEPDPASDDPLVRLDYATPTPRQWPTRMLDAVGRLPPLLGIGVLALFVPLPHGIWYAGSRPQWVIAIEASGFTIGHSDGSSRWVHLDSSELLILKSAVVLVTIWAIVRWRRNRRNPALSPT